MSTWENISTDALKGFLCSWPMLMKFADNTNLGNKKYMLKYQYTKRFQILGKEGFSHCNCNIQSIE